MLMRYRSLPQLRRILASYYQMNQDGDGFPGPGHGMSGNLSLPHEIVDARNKSAKPTLFDGAVEGHVLVKNLNGTLPLDPDKLKLVSLFGYSARSPDYNTPEAADSKWRFGPWAVGAQAANATEVNIGWMGNLSIPYSDIAPNGTLISGGGSGASAQSLISAPFDALVDQCYEDGTAMFWDLESADPAVNPTSDACIVFGNVWPTEGYEFEASLALVDDAHFIGLGIDEDRQPELTQERVKGWCKQIYEEMYLKELES